MTAKRKQHQKKKTTLHPRSKHHGRYNFDELLKVVPKLSDVITPNKFGDLSINFFDPYAVKLLNTALLKFHYGINFWDIPSSYLCPPIPSRADYIHNLADLLTVKNKNNIPKGKHIKCIDIGVGANCIYPIIGIKEYGWFFVGTDIDDISITSAKKIVNNNKDLKNNITLRLQPLPKQIFEGVIHPDEKFHITMCNPPFHASLEEASASTSRKIKNLTKSKTTKPILNFGGKHNELWCDGGEAKFIQDMIYESRRFKTNCLWFTTLVSKASNLKGIYSTLKKVNAKEIKTLPMGQGHKISRIVAWTFLDKTEQNNWKFNKS
ncbi:23S rRNA (adenine(1618)-N(6))-methyltransferase RlmF [Hyunsoonleella pacifica]|uniref:Ribosomal RNA large subunit methyltransferase F n=1 Tax=Hyunsoonleella pacifica TaxID=1080224 RepID=A0A4Q9FQ60_9FLAO|nr:23S rRNA (adenine(1618)-N(6))-methyltransferase RlmF [Hyunsoonleella pacifica]TBN16361.1 23S rRNA (adenine(1618)-N(6))-methyltransferase RlmF [Hyunsoonleella pacifica]GGD20101.1 ribosomal RNA large subunit methyltransferase F [Hyunsoonleella pacifica]